MNNCKTTNCKNLTAIGDKLFCFICRTKWINYCKEQGIDEKIISIELEEKHLNNFLRRENATVNGT